MREGATGFSPWRTVPDYRRVPAGKSVNQHASTMVPFRLVLAVAKDPDGGPVQCLPRIGVVSIPDLDPLLAFRQHAAGGTISEAFLCRRVQLGNISLQAHHGV